MMSCKNTKLIYENTKLKYENTKLICKNTKLICEKTKLICEKTKYFTKVEVSLLGFHSDELRCWCCWCFAVLSLYALPFYLKRLTCKRIMADYSAVWPCAVDNKVRKLPVLEVYYDDR